MVSVPTIVTGHLLRQGFHRQGTTSNLTVSLLLDPEKWAPGSLQSEDSKHVLCVSCVNAEEDGTVHVTDISLCSKFKQLQWKKRVTNV